MKRGRKIFIAIIIIVLLVAIYFTFFCFPKCNDLACFRAHQQKCSKAKYLDEAESVLWKYRILGKEDGKCEIEVEVLRINEGGLDKKVLEGKSMMCLLPLGSISAPESDLSGCRGFLKEELQGLIIRKLHTYVLDNIGEINEELQKPL